MKSLCFIKIFILTILFFLVYRIMLHLASVYKINNLKRKFCNKKR